MKRHAGDRGLQAMFNMLSHQRTAREQATGKRDWNRGALIAEQHAPKRAHVQYEFLRGDRYERARALIAVFRRPQHYGGERGDIRGRDVRSPVNEIAGIIALGARKQSSEQSGLWLTSISRRSRRAERATHKPHCATFVAQAFSPASTTFFVAGRSASVGNAARTRDKQHAWPIAKCIGERDLCVSRNDDVVRNFARAQRLHQRLTRCFAPAACDASAEHTRYFVCGASSCHRFEDERSNCLSSGVNTIARNRSRSTGDRREHTAGTIRHNEARLCTAAIDTDDNSAFSHGAQTTESRPGTKLPGFGSCVLPVLNAENAEQKI
jgi:hypothetical protein